jgi:hypothetical protein
MASMASMASLASSFAKAKTGIKPTSWRKEHKRRSDRPDAIQEPRGGSRASKSGHHQHAEVVDAVDGITTPSNSALGPLPAWELEGE